MGWLELTRWIELLDDQRKGASTNDPNTWAGTDRDEWWGEARRRREELRGR